jgi:group II intron maturase
MRRVRWHDRRNGSSSGSASRLVQTPSAQLRRNLWSGLSGESGITRRAKGVSIETTMEELVPYMRGWRGYLGFCETPEVLIALTRWVRLRLRLPSGANGKHRGVGEQHSSRWESRGSCATWPLAAVDPGISPGAKPSPSDSPMPTSNRSVFRP